jgi:hypothetical protein
MFYIILFIVLLLGSISLNLFNVVSDKEQFSNYVPLKELTHKYGEPTEEVKRVNSGLDEKGLNARELNTYQNYINDKELLHRRNYNTISAEEYYKMLYTEPITPIEEDLKYIPINKKKYKNIGDMTDKILDEKLIKHKPLSSHVWHMVHDIDPENLNRMFLPPQYYIPYK